MSNLLAGRGAAGFSRHHNGESALSQSFRQFLDLRALARAIQTFKRNELAAMRWGHGWMIKQESAGVRCLGLRFQLLRILEFEKSGFPLAALELSS